MRFKIVSVMITGIAAVCHSTGLYALSPQAIKPIIQHYADIVYANYEDALTSAEGLESAVQRFIEEPTEINLRQAQFQWKSAREFYGQTEAFRFAGSPLEDEKKLEKQINGWPLDPSFIDFVLENPSAGFVQNPAIPLTKSQLIALNGLGGEKSVSTGWHAIEFMLWGQDVFEDSAGRRALSDFTTHPFAERRKLYLATVTRILLDDLRYLKMQWQPNQAKNFRQRFLAKPQLAVHSILEGLIILSHKELASERLETALISQDSADEPSTFSDNTHRDAVTNAQGIANVWFGSYSTIAGEHLSGACYHKVLQQLDPILAQKIESALRTSIMSANEIRPPFDQEILIPDGRVRIQATIDSLRLQADLLEKAAKRLEICPSNQHF